MWAAQHCLNMFWLCMPDYLLFVFHRDVDDVHDMMDDISEQHEIANEIANAISSPVGFGQDIDEVRIFDITF